MLSKNYVGIDYHLNSIQVCVLSADGKRLGNRKCSNDCTEVIEYISRFGGVARGAVEVCCGSATFVEQVRKLAGWNFELCHPGYVKRMKHNPDKSDKSDAELIADLCRVGYIAKVWLCPENIRQLREIVRYRSQQVEWRKKLKLRIRAILRNLRVKTPPRFSLNTKWSLEWLRENLQCLPEESKWVMQKHLVQLEATSKEIGEVEAKLKEWVASDKLTKHLLSLPGIGLVAATLIRAEVCTATRFKRAKELARFCGLSPRNSSSGERQSDSGIIKAGNSELKKVIIQIAHSKRRLERRWIEFAARLNKPPLVTVAAIANRWVRSLYHEMLRFELA